MGHTTCGSRNRRVRALALDLWPAVVVALDDQVQLVPGVLPELRGPQPAGVVEGEPLRRCGGRGSTPVSRGPGCPVRGSRPGDPQDLPAERARVLGEGVVAGLAGGDVEIAVGAEGEPAAVVDRPARDPGEDGSRSAEPVAVEGQCEHAIVAVGGGVDEDPVVLGVRRGDREAEQAGLAHRAGSGRPGPRDGPVLRTTCRIRPLSRSVTRAEPSGRKSMPQGTSRWSATVPRTRGGPVGAGEAVVGVGVPDERSAPGLAPFGVGGTLSAGPEPPHPATVAARARVSSSEAPCLPPGLVRSARPLTRASVASRPQGTRSSRSSSSSCTSSGRSMATKWLASSRT